MSIIAFKEKDGTINMTITGNVSSDPELKDGDRGGKVRFSVAYGKKKFQSVEAFADSAAGRLAGCLEKGDRVSVSGTWESWEYNDKKYDILRADFIQVQQDAPAEEENGADARKTPKNDEPKQNVMDEYSEVDEDLPF